MADTPVTTTSAAAPVTTGAQLIAVLADKAHPNGGSPEHTLAPLREFVKDNPNATAAQVAAHLEKHPARQFGTLKKVWNILGAKVQDVADASAYPVRAPEGGATVAGTAYAAGAVIPTAVVAKATPDENLMLRRVAPADPVPATTPADPGTPSPDAAATTATAPAKPVKGK